LVDGDKCRDVIIILVVHPDERDDMVDLPALFYVAKFLEACDFQLLEDILEHRSNLASLENVPRYCSLDSVRGLKIKEILLVKMLD
jgi:hypothetical protein